MTIKSILSNYHNFKEQKLINRFFKHQDVEIVLANLPSIFKVNNLGKSVNGRNINLVKWGKGKIKIMLWSQMHGNEATGTMALIDLLKFLNQQNEIVKLINENCQLHIIPMVNPDGAEIFNRRNAQQIDINRDYLQTITPEAKILKKYRNYLQPEFGFNLHDQTTLWSVTGSIKPATLSFLAPAIDQILSINKTREKAMFVIADIFIDMDKFIPKHIGLFDDEFEPRAFGDNFQIAGTSTILIEAGGYKNDDEKQEIRKYYFGAILSGLLSIAKKSYLKQNIENYFAIPKNSKQLFHIIIQKILLNGAEVSIGLNYEEVVNFEATQTVKKYSITDIGDLSFSDAYQVFSSSKFKLKREIILNELANFDLIDGDHIILSFQNGELV